MRVLVAAFACRPGEGSELGVGWAVADAASHLGHDVVLLTQPRHQKAIEEVRRTDAELRDRLHPVYLGLPAPAMEMWSKTARLRGLQMYYVAWQRSLRRVATRLHAARPFDVAHHVTLSADWVASGLADIPDLPLVWGPLGGGEQVPTSCYTWLGPRGRLGALARRTVLEPLRRRARSIGARGSALVVAQNEDEAALLRGHGAAVVIRPNAFLDPAPPPTEVPAGGPGHPPASSGADRAEDVRVPRRAVFAGRLVAWKGIHLAVDVIAQPEVGNWELHVYGSGPERRAVERRIHREGLAQRVVLQGQQPRAVVRTAMAGADALLYPSFRDPSPWVVAEALMEGCPVICLDTAGAPVLLKGPHGEHATAAGAGRAVPPGPSMTTELARALAATPAAARRRVSWDAGLLPDLLTDWYGRVVGQTHDGRGKSTEADHQ